MSASNALRPLLSAPGSMTKFFKSMGTNVSSGFRALDDALEKESSKSVKRVVTSSIEAQDEMELPRLLTLDDIIGVEEEIEDVQQPRLLLYGKRLTAYYKALKCVAANQHSDASYTGLAIELLQNAFRANDLQHEQIMAQLSDEVMDIVDSKLFHFEVMTLEKIRGMRSIDEKPERYHNKLYQIVLLALTDYENSARYGGSALGLRPLSGTAVRILEEFVESYRVNKEKVVLYDLELLISRFHPSPTHLFWLMEKLRALRDLRESVKFEQRNESMLLRFQDLAAVLRHQLKSCLMNYKTLFPENKPPGALATIIRLLCDLIEANGVFIAEEQQPGCVTARSAEVLKECLQAALLSAFQKKFTSDDMDASMLLEMCDFVCEELQEDIECYYSSFPPEVEPLRVLAEKGIELVLTAAAEVASACPPVPPQLLQTLLRLRQLNADLLGVLPSFDIGEELDALFVPVVSYWLSETASNMRTWAKSGCRSDKWVPVSDEPGQGYANSVTDVFLACSQALLLLRSYRMCDPVIISQFAQLVCHIGATYVSQILKITNEEILASHPAKDREEKKLLRSFTGIMAKVDESVPHFDLTTPHCVRLNSIAAVGIHLDELLTEVEADLAAICEIREERCGGDEARVKVLRAENEQTDDAVKKCFQSTFSVIKQGTRTLIDMLYTQIQPELTVVFTAVIAAASERVGQRGSHIDTSKLRVFLDERLKVLHLHCDQRVFQSFLRRVVEGVAEVLVESVAPPVSTKAREHRGSRMERMTDVMDLMTDLRAYFHADGDGVATKEIDSAFVLAKMLVGMNDLPTDALIAQHQALVAAQARAPSPLGTKEDMPTVRPCHLLGLLATRPKDKAAKNYVEKLKSEAEDLRVKGAVRTLGRGIMESISGVIIITDGVSDGLVHGVGRIGDGVAGIVEKPKQGMNTFFKGVSKGVSGVGHLTASLGSDARSMLRRHTRDEKG